MTSAYFSKGALKALNRMGDILIPGDGELPSFSEYGGLEHVDKIAAYAPAEDIQALNAVLGILNLLPTFALRILIGLLASARTRKGPLAPLFRQLNLGIRGLVYSSYYDERPGSQFKGKDPAEVINFHIVRVED